MTGAEYIAAFLEKRNCRNVLNNNQIGSKIDGKVNLNALKAYWSANVLNFRSCSKSRKVK